MRHNKALHLTLCCSLGLLPQDRRAHESAAESGRYDGDEPATKISLLHVELQLSRPLSADLGRVLLLQAV